MLCLFTALVLCASWQKACNTATGSKPTLLCSCCCCWFILVLLPSAPYSALAKKFVRKWLAGYGFDPEKQVLRGYLSTLKPKPPKMQGMLNA